MMSRLLLVMGAAPVLAPTLGSQLLRWTQWRGVFVTLAGIAVLLLVLAGLGLPETLPPARRLHRRRPRQPHGVRRPAAGPDLRRAGPGRRA